MPILRAVPSDDRPVLRAVPASRAKRPQPPYAADPIGFARRMLGDDDAAWQGRLREFAAAHGCDLDTAADRVAAGVIAEHLS